jgi:hypothetical protein
MMTLMQAVIRTLILLGVSWSCFASQGVLIDMGNDHSFPAISNGCSDVLVALGRYLGVAGYSGLTPVSCQTATFEPPFPKSINFDNGMVWNVSGVSGPYCSAGLSLDTTFYQCTGEGVGSAGSGCVPSIRTISPCPSGFAPAGTSPLHDGPPDPYISEFDTMPVQDMLYSVGMCLFGLLGISVGVKLS